jgi:hypothetical protein
VQPAPQHLSGPPRLVDPRRNSACNKPTACFRAELASYRDLARTAPLCTRLRRPIHCLCRHGSAAVDCLLRRSARCRTPTVQHGLAAARPARRQRACARQAGNQAGALHVVDAALAPGLHGPRVGGRDSEPRPRLQRRRRRRCHGGRRPLQAQVQRGAAQPPAPALAAVSAAGGKRCCAEILAHESLSHIALRGQPPAGRPKLHQLHPAEPAAAAEQPAEPDAQQSLHLDAQQLLLSSMYVTLEPARLALGAAILITAPVASRPHAPQLPPIQSNMSPESFYPQSATAQLNAVYNREARSPRTATNPNPPQPLPLGGGPVPKFQIVKSTADLQPKINTQPPFRRANPEGGFISVSGGGSN